MRERSRRRTVRPLFSPSTHLLFRLHPLALTTLHYTPRPTILHIPPRDRSNTTPLVRPSHHSAPYMFFPLTPTLPHTLSSPLSHTFSIPFHTIIILSEPNKSTSRHQDMELSISKLPTPPSFNPQVSDQLCLLGFPTVSETGPLPLFGHQGAAPVTSCPVLCLRPELSLESLPKRLSSPPLLSKLLSQHFLILVHV